MSNAHDLAALQPLVITLVRRHAGGLDRNDQDDVTQEVYLHLMQQMPKYDASRAAFSTWAFRVAQNRIIDLLRQRGRHHTADVDVADLADDHGGASDTTTDEISRIDAATLKQVLTKRQRMVYDALNTGEQRQVIAANLGIRADSLSQMTARIGQRLRQHFGSEMLNPIAA